MNNTAMNKNTRKRITFELDSQLKKKLETRARRDDLDVSKVIRHALRNFLEMSTPRRLSA